MFVFNFIIFIVCVPSVLARFDALSRNSISVYWGQNALSQANNSLAQQRLSHYCKHSNIDLIPIGFVTSFGDLVTNFASATDVCEAVEDTNSKYCPQIEQDIVECQETYGKTITLSLGGATYSEGGFPSDDAAVTAANKIWASFGPLTNEPPTKAMIRPFGKAVVDGFDLDIETPSSNMKPFANQLRSLMDAAASGPNGKRYYLTAAPQCPFPDKQFGPLLDGTIAFDAVMVQFYNNICGADSYVAGSTSQERFNFAAWDNWAKSNTKNPNIKVMLGIAGGQTGAKTGYVSGDTLKSLIEYSMSFSSFGGVMIWDMTEIEANQSFLKNVVDAVGARQRMGTAAVAEEFNVPSYLPSTRPNAKDSTSSTASTSLISRSYSIWVLWACLFTLGTLFL
ncbi:hypothetical protein K3495_g10682 [Podosphaera aphanis]|nr:hypothetical protein K3495_g10682 [Podosphaera aphanis]